MTTVFQQTQNAVFPELSDIEIDNLEAEFTEKYAFSMRDTSLPIEERHLKHLVQQKAEPQNREWELWAVQQIPIRKLLPQLRDHSNEIYLAMEKTQNWGTMGKERISISHCRHILNIPAHRLVSWPDKAKMDLIINSLDNKLGNKTGDEMIRYCIDRTFSLFGKNYTSFYELMDFIELMDAGYYFYTNSGPFCGEFIFGEITWTEIGNKQRIYTFVNEWSRSPSHILGLVGRSGNPMQIRYQALEQVWYNKWVQSFDNILFQRTDRKKNPNGYVHDTLQNIAMFKNGLVTPKVALRTKDTLLSKQPPPKVVALMRASKRGPLVVRGLR
jgi:hypothetical protein